MKLPIVLLVEDNPDDAFFTERALKKGNRKDFELVKVNNAIEALEYIFENIEEGKVKNRPDIILLDLNMPKMSGVEFLRKLKSINATFDIPVIILTTSMAEEDMVECYNLGIKNYIVKPFEFQRFIQEIQQIGLYPYLFKNDHRKL